MTPKELETFLVGVIETYLERPEPDDEIVGVTQNGHGLRVRQKQGPDFLVTVKEAS